MEVIINGIKYIPETDKTVEVNGNLYESINNFGMIEVHGSVYCGIEGYLQYVYGCMLSKWLNEAIKHDGMKVSDVPELVAMKKEIDTFLEYTEKFLGFKEVDGGFKEIKK